jgi:hypothetical protein
VAVKLRRSEDRAGGLSSSSQTPSLQLTTAGCFTGRPHGARVLLLLLDFYDD